MDYFFSNKFFGDKQHRFIKGRSTVLQLLNILDDWTERYIWTLKRHLILFHIKDL